MQLQLEAACTPAHSESHCRRYSIAAPLPSPTTSARCATNYCRRTDHTATQATSRLSKNIKYFRVNYAMTILATTALCFLASPAALLVLAFLAAVWFFLLVLKPGPIELGGRVFGYVVICTVLTSLLLLQGA